MTQPRLELEAESWAFALDIYARAGVADACLTLQNEAGVDVTMMLMVIFAAVRYRPIAIESPPVWSDHRSACDEAVGHVVKEEVAVAIGSVFTPAEAQAPG